MGWIQGQGIMDWPVTSRVLWLITGRVFWAPANTVTWGSKSGIWNNFQFVNYSSMLNSHMDFPIYLFDKLVDEGPRTVGRVEKTKGRSRLWCCVAASPRLRQSLLERIHRGNQETHKIYKISKAPVFNQGQGNHEIFKYKQASTDVFLIRSTVSNMCWEARFQHIGKCSTLFSQVEEYR